MEPSPAPPSSEPARPPSGPVPSPGMALALVGTLALLFPFVGGGVQLAAKAAGVFPLGLLWTEAYLFFAPALLLARAFSGRPFEALGLGRPGFAPIAWGFALGLANYPLAGALEAVVRLTLPGLAKLLPDLSGILAGVPPSQRALLVIAVALSAPLGEEVLFRGLLQNSLAQRMRGAWAVAIAAVIFSAVHYEPIGLLARIELGALFGLLVLWTGSTWASIAAHGASNLFAITLYFLTQHDAAEAANFGQLAWTGGLGLLLTIPLLLGVHAWSRRHTPHERAWEPPPPMRPTALSWLISGTLSALALVVAALVRGA